MELSRITTLHVGGPAARYERVTTESQLRDAALSAWSDGDEWLVLGGGSNVVVADQGFEGSVIHVATTGIDRLEDAGGRVRLRVQAGESWDGLVAHAVAHGWSGIEALSGIPGSAGAAPIQNIGAYGQELSGSLTVTFRGTTIAKDATRPVSLTVTWLRTTVPNTTTPEITAQSVKL